MEYVMEEVEVSVLDTNNKTQTKTKLLSSSFVDDAPMFKIGSSALSPAAKQLILIVTLALLFSLCRSCSGLCNSEYTQKNSHQSHDNSVVVRRMAAACNQSCRV
jgi:hypothetical protein